MDGSKVTEEVCAQSISETESDVRELTEEEWEERVPEPLDGGWGWIIVLASFFNNFILDGIAYCFGIFLPELVESLGVSVAEASLANSLLCGIYLLVGPVAGALINKYGLRLVGVAGSITASVGFLLSAFSPSLLFLQLTYGVVGGCGFGLMYLPAVVGVGYYFERKRAVATSIAVSGTGFGVFTFAPVGKIMLQQLGWRNAHILLAGVILQGCVSVAVMRPLLPKAQRKKARHHLDTIEEIAEEEQVQDTRFIDSQSLIPSPEPHPRSLHESTIVRIPGSKNHMNADDLQRPLYRKDIFFSGSVYNLSQFKSQLSVKSCVASITSIPSIEHHENRLPCFNKLPKPMADILAEMLDPKILRNRGMLVLCVANVIGMLGFYVPFIFTISRAESLDIGNTQAAFLLSVMGICNTAGRLLSGIITLIPNASPLMINNISVIVCGLAVLLHPFCLTYPAMMASIALYGLFSGLIIHLNKSSMAFIVAPLVSLASVITLDLVGLEKLTNAFGLLCLVRGMTAIMGPPLEGLSRLIAGKLYDLTGSYNATFYVGGSCLIVCGLLHFLLMLPYFKPKNFTQ